MTAFFSADRGSFATTLTSEEVERCNTRSTLVFVSTVDHAIDVVDFLKTGGEAAPILSMRLLQGTDQHCVIVCFLQHLG